MLLVFLALGFGRSGANGSLARAEHARRVEPLSSSDAIETIGSALAALALAPPAAGAAGTAATGAGDLREHERHGYERAEQQQGDRPQPALHELAPGVR